VRADIPLYIAESTKGGVAAEIQGKEIAPLIEAAVNRFIGVPVRIYRMDMEVEETSYSSAITYPKSKTFLCEWNTTDTSKGQVERLTDAVKRAEAVGGFVL